MEEIQVIERVLLKVLRGDDIDEGELLGCLWIINQWKLNPADSPITKMGNLKLVTYEND